MGGLLVVKAWAEKKQFAYKALPTEEQSHITVNVLRERILPGSFCRQVKSLMRSHCVLGSAKMPSSPSAQILWVKPKNRYGFLVCVENTVPDACCHYWEGRAAAMGFEEPAPSASFLESLGQSKSEKWDIIKRQKGELSPSFQKGSQMPLQAGAASLPGMSHLQVILHSED